MDDLTEHAMAVVEAGIAAAAARGRPEVAVAVVDPIGEPVALLRSPGAAAACIRLALATAASSARMAVPSAELAALRRDDPALWEALGAVVPEHRMLRGRATLVAVPGGLPLMVDGSVVGGVGVCSSATDPVAQEDDADIAAEAAGPGATDRSTGADRAIAPAPTSGFPALSTLRVMLAAARAESASLGAAATTAIVGHDGDLVGLWAMGVARRAFVSDIAMTKAYTGWRFQAAGPLYESLGERSALWTAMSQLAPEPMIPSEGAVTLVDERGACIGAIGVAGTVDVDYRVCEHAAAVAGVSFVPRSFAAG